MSGGPNSKQTDSTIVVPTLAALAQVWVAQLDEGSIAYVSVINKQFVLRKASPLVADGATVIAPDAGSPSAGAPTAKWVLDVAISGGILQSAEAMLATDEQKLAGAFSDVPGMSLMMTTSAVGGILLIDVATSFNVESGDVDAEAALRVLVDDVQVGTAGFDFPSDVTASGSIVRRLVVAPGLHTIKLQWMANEEANCNPVTRPDDHFMALRVIETAS